MKRRDFLKQSIALGVTPVLASGAPTIKVGACHAFFLDQTLMVYQNNRLMVDYQFHPNRKSPCFGRLVGPRSGLSLTTTTRHPWNDFGQTPYPNGIITTLGANIKSCDHDTVEFTHLCQWCDRENRPVMKDDRHFSIRFLSESVYTIDCSFTMTPLADVSIEPTNHSFLGLKTASDIAPDGGGKLRNSSGQEGMKNTFGKNAKWCTCFGPRQGLKESLVEGVAVFAVDSPFEQAGWFTRDYGFLAPDSLHFLTKAWERSLGDSFTLRYRVVAYSGDPDDNMLNRLNPF